MKARQIRPNVYWVGAIDWDMPLLDALILLPDGTSHDAYLVGGSHKVSSIDIVYGNDSQP